MIPLNVPPDYSADDIYNRAPPETTVEANNFSSRTSNKILMAMTPDLEYFAVPLDFSKYEMNLVESDPVDEHSTSWPETEPATVYTYPTIPFSSPSPSSVLPYPPSTYSQNTLSSPIHLLSHSPSSSPRSPSPVPHSLPSRSQGVATTPEFPRHTDLPTEPSPSPDLESSLWSDDESLPFSESEMSQSSPAEVDAPDLDHLLAPSPDLDPWLLNYVEEVSKAPRTPDLVPAPLRDDVWCQSPSHQPPESSFAPLATAPAAVPPLEKSVDHICDVPP